MKKIFLFITFLVSIGIIFYFWFLRSGSLLNTGQTGLFIALGRLAGLLAVYFVLWQLILVGRVKFLEKIFGLDKLFIVHHFNGLLAWILICLHPIFIIIGYKMANDNSLWSQILEFLFNWDELLTAFLAIMIFIVVIGVSTTIIKKRMKYETWYVIHILVYLAIILAFSHQLEYGYTLQNKIFFVYWYLLYWAAFGLLVFYRFVKPVKLFLKHRFYVSKIEQECENVLSVYISGNRLAEFNFLGGQFAIFRFLDSKLALEGHPFSFSQAKNGDDIRISIKSLGDFTSSLSSKLKVGTKVVIDGPHGIFTNKRTANNKIALLAGGVGITPIRAIAESAQDKDTIILYSAVCVNDFIFKKEFDSFKSASTTHFVNGQAKDWNGEKGRIDEEKIKRLVPDYLERSFYVCGPPLFLKNIIKTLKDLGVPKKNIYFEKFSLS